jgi:mxaD protein
MNNQLLAGVVTFGLLLSGAGNAAEPLHVVKSINIEAPASKTWQKVFRFGDLGAWHPAVAKTQIVVGQEGVSGADRVLTLQDGGIINETLTAYNANERSMSYVITESVLPVNNYASTIRVLSNGDNKSVVVWEGAFQSKEAASDKVALDTISSVYDGGLANLKKITE